MQIKQRFCYLVDMNPPRKSKPGKIRPVVVIQTTDTIEAGSTGITCIPLTTKLLPENILRTRLTGSKKLKLKQPSDALLDQVHTVDRTLFLEELGEISDLEFTKIKKGVEFLLGL